MSRRGVVLIVVALVLSAGLLGVQLASGGADFVPQRAADPCKDRDRPASQDIEGLAEAVVLTGIDEAACKLGVSRERLLLALPSPQDRAKLARDLGTDERGLAQSIKDGLRAGVDRLERQGRLPAVSTLLPSIAGQLGIPEGLAGVIPGSLVDALPSTADLLHLGLDTIDVNNVLAELDNGKSLDVILRQALIQGAIAKAKGTLPGPLQGLLGG